MKEFMSKSGYYNSPWPGEDGSARRLQIPNDLTGLNIGEDDQANTTIRRLWWDFGNMVVLSEKEAWFLDHGKHTYQFQMIGAGVSKNPINFIRVSLTDASDTTIQAVSGIPKGTVTNPPLFAEDRQILIIYDSGNSVIRALKYKKDSKTFEELWKKEDFGCSSHMIYYPNTGELCTNDYKTFTGDSSVVLDIETGEEKFRTKLRNIFQGVVFPSPGWNRDYYYLTLDSLVRVSLE